MGQERLKLVGVGFAILAFTTFSYAGVSREDSAALGRVFADLDESWRWYVILGAAFILLRLLCDFVSEKNRLASNRKVNVSDLYGDVFQRIADTFIILGCTLVASGPYRLDLGWFCAIAAFGTAYVQTLGDAVCAKRRVVSPLLKHYRMAALLLGAVLLAIFPDDVRSHNIMDAVLFIVSVGALYASWRELRTIARDMSGSRDLQT